MKKKILLISLFLVMLFGFSFNYMRVKADSGWDSDYDFDSGGGGFDFDWGDSDYDYDYDGGYSGGGGGGIFGTIVFLIIIFIIINAPKSKNTNNRYLSTTSINKDYIINSITPISESTIQEKIPGFNKAIFLENAYKTFLDVQDAWSEFDTDKLKTLLSDELFNTYNSQLKALKIKKQKNVMSDFVEDYIEITNFEYINGKATITARLLVSFYDYVVDKDEKVIRGTRDSKVNNNYILTFIMSETKSNKNKKCPSCNAPLEDNVTNKCPYCNTKIVHDSYNWVLSKKQAIGRYNK